MNKNIIIEEESDDIRRLNEMVISVQPSLPTEIENSIFYPKLKQLLHVEIFRFCKEQVELKEDLNIFRQLIGEVLTESQIREYLDGLKTKYNGINNNVGLDYQISATRIDYCCPVFVVIKRDVIHMKKFVFRFRKAGGIGTPLDGLTVGGLFDGE